MRCEVPSFWEQFEFDLWIPSRSEGISSFLEGNMLASHSKAKTKVRMNEEKLGRVESGTARVLESGEDGAQEARGAS